MRAVTISGGLALCAATWIVAYKIYEDHATGGAGFYYAEDLILDDAMPVDIRKKAFFDFMRPVSEAENARILALRSRILLARKNGENPHWLLETGLDYGIEWTGREWDRLLKRVDTIPVTLILTQSANESSWAQSRFARIGNNMFGQWCFTEGCGMVPSARDTGKRHEVATYRSVNDSVRAYLNNINSSRAYAKLRVLRWWARQQGREANGVELAAGLLSYSERSQDYVRDIQSMIRANRGLIIGE